MRADIALNKFSSRQIFRQIVRIEDAHGLILGKKKTGDFKSDGVFGSADLRHQLYDSLSSTLHLRGGLFESDDNFSSSSLQRFGGGFTEAYNKRATARFLAGDLVGAMDDCQRALDLEPHHFGSLAGYGHIYFRLDDMDMAILYWRRALAVNPNLDSVARSIDAAERILRGRGRLQT